MKNKMIAVLLALALCIGVSSATAFAYVENDINAEETTGAAETTGEETTEDSTETSEKEGESGAGETETSADQTWEAAEAAASMNRNLLPSVLLKLLLAAGGGVFAWYRMKAKKKEASKPDPDADYEYDDEGEDENGRRAQPAYRYMVR